MIRPYLPPAKPGRATVRRVTDTPKPRGRGRPPSPAVAAIKSQIAGLAGLRPSITPAEVAAELGIPGYRASRLLAELRQSGLAAQPVAVAVNGRKLTHEIRGRRRRRHALSRSAFAAVAHATHTKFRTSSCACAVTFPQR